MRSAAAEGGRLEQWVSPMLTDRERVAIFHFFRVLRMPSRRPAHINPTPKTVPAHLACSPDNQTTAASRMFGSADFADCPPLGSSPLPALQAATSIRPKKNSGGPILLWLTRFRRQQSNLHKSDNAFRHEFFAGSMHLPTFRQT